MQLAGVPAVLAAAYHSLMPQGMFRDAEVLAEIQEVHGETFFSKVTREQLQTLMRHGEAAVVDARLPSDYRRGHVPGAINIPVTLGIEDVRVCAERLSKEGPVVVYCQSQACRFAGRGAYRLHSLGFQDVRIYRGGWYDWSRHRERNLPTAETARQNRMSREGDIAKRDKSSSLGAIVSGITVLGLGTVLVIAAASKTWNPYSFLSGVYRYEIVGPPLGVVVAAFLPFLELTVGIMLLLERVRKAVMGPSEPVGGS